MTNLVQRLKTSHTQFGVVLCGEAADRIEQLEAEVFEQCRINGMGGEREAALMAKVERLEHVAEQRRKDSERYRWLVEYFVSTDEQYDDALVDASNIDVEAVTAVVDTAMKEKA